jgi:hypothetical protein
MTDMSLDLAYRWLFGMIPGQLMVEEMHRLGIVNTPVSLGDLFDGVKRPKAIIDIGPDTEGFACANKLQDIYEKYTDSMRCSQSHIDVYRLLVNYIIGLIYTNNINVVLVDLANMMAGQLQNRNWEQAVDQLPVQYQGLPVLYIIIKPARQIEQAEFIGNKVILPVVCLVPHDGSLKPCGRGVMEADDMLLLQVYEYIYRKYPAKVFVLSGDKYSWMGKNNLPSVYMNMLKLISRPTGLSNYSLDKSGRTHNNRILAYGVSDQQVPFGVRAPSPNPSPNPNPNPNPNPVSQSSKRVLCRSYTTTGHCPYGNRCLFAHGRNQLDPGIQASAYKTKPCKLGMTCPKKNKNCNFVHPDEIYM